MKMQRIYEFEVRHGLDAARRAAIEAGIKENAALSPKPVLYGWDEATEDLLHIVIEPINIEVSFRPNKVEVSAAAPLWAKVGFTDHKKNELKQLVETVLQKANFGVTAVEAPETAPKKGKRGTGAIA